MKFLEKYRSGFIALVGRPNVGKSTLLNRFVGEKIAIMSDKAQTTRNKIQGVYTDQEAQIIFIDTPGIHKPKHKLGQYMLDITYDTLGEVDCIVYVFDVGQKFGSGEQFILGLLKKVNTPVILLLNKIDLLQKEQLLPIIKAMSEQYSFEEIIPLSAKTGENLSHVLDILKNYLPPGPKYYPEEMITDQPEIFLMEEMIREKVLHLTQEEIPHSVAVKIDNLIERPENTIYLAATIYLERDSQKGILIGKKGRMLKEIGTLSRLEIEKLLGSKIFLDLHIKVKPNWRQKETELRSLGYDKREQ
ncbi:MAG: GTPase Era [Bacillota bacterium]